MPEFISITLNTKERKPEASGQPQQRQMNAMKQIHTEIALEKVVTISNARAEKRGEYTEMREKNAKYLGLASTPQNDN